MQNPGQTLGHFRLVTKLAAGREGDLWQAVDTRTDTEVAVKSMSPSIAEDPTRHERVRGLIEQAAKLDHPNIAKMYTLEHADGACFATMELVQGTPISKRIPENGASLESFLEWVMPLTDALQTAHELGVLHGDLKPANIVLDADDRLRVLGFGLSEIADPNLGASPDEVPTLTISRDDLSLTTIPYVCPELIKAKPISERTDLFSLGSVMYQIATGRPPFTGESPADVVVAILYDRPAAIAEFNPLLPRRLGDTIFRCLEKEAGERFATIRDLRDELRSL